MSVDVNWMGYILHSCMCVNKFSSNLIWKANKKIHINSWFVNLYKSYIVVI